jgi:hypothetical protein
MSRSKRDRQKRKTKQNKAADRTAVPTLGQICASPDDFLAKLDVAAINLICASGLPGAEVIQLDANLAWLNDAADKVRLETERNYVQFLGNPSAFDYSQAKFCIRILITVLQRQCGVRYNPKWQGITSGSPIPRDFGRSAVDLFIHSIIDGAGGTCGSLPVLYVAVGRDSATHSSSSKRIGTYSFVGTMRAASGGIIPSGSISRRPAPASISYRTTIIASGRWNCRRKTSNRVFFSSRFHRSRNSPSSLPHGAIACKAMAVLRMRFKRWLGQNN